MKVACVAHARGALRAFALARSAWLTSALLLAVACGDSSEPEVGQDASSVVPNIDASITMVAHDAAMMMTGQPGGTQGGGTMGAGGQPGITGGMIPRVDAGGPADAGRPVVSDAGMAADSGVTMPVGDGGDPYAEVRQVCVDTINMYRATRNLPPLMRADPMREACSDEGAKYDGDLNRGRDPSQVVGHKSTMNRSPACAKVGFGSQDACPNWGVGARTGNPTLADAIKRCLAQMWAEGEPPIPVDQCKMDQTPGGCFLTHGHWINMTSTNSTWVACGFYNVQGGTYWMNQDFDYRFR